MAGKTSQETKLDGRVHELNIDEDASDPKVFVLERELAEVHLLLENLSANPDKALSIEHAKADRLPERWIEEICQLNWPPKGTRQQLAEQAALLIRAKDFLNRQAKPASGASIAFTLLVAQGRDQAGGDAGASRISLARQAYPGLVRQSRWFRYSMWALSIVLGLFLVLTCLLSWYTAFGAATLSQRAVAQNDLAAAQKRVDDQEAAGATAGGAPKSVDQSSALAAQRFPSAYAVRFCQRSEALPPLKVPGGAIDQFYTVADIQLCDNLYKAQYNVAAIDRILIDWLKAMNWVQWQLLVRPSPGENLAIPVLADTLLHILSGAVLPVSYGILGAAAAVVRSISRKFRESRLSPRDMTLSLQQLAMGAVTGSCIGLFTAQPGATPQTAAGLISAVALSSSALSFIAGFGVEQVFGTLELIIRRVFPGNDPAPTASPNTG